MLRGEHLIFHGDDVWSQLLDKYPDYTLDQAPTAPASVLLKLDDSDIWFDITIPKNYGMDDGAHTFPLVAAKGEQLGRAEQEKWNSSVVERLQEVRDSEWV